ncbi:MAG: flagellar hook-associated protein FlgK [Spirochaetaceae bacterium]|jgi:flagellar hook-associated protein 1 FlgK|nr:flagellar hook-associated protein FlgK [Spirochaetaceae bacterium]
MTSTFSALEMGKRSLGAHEQALQTTGHNLSNASTEGYSRQRVEFAEMDPVFMPGLNREERPGQLGQGVVVSRIERIRDELLDRRIVAQAGGEGYWKTRDPYVRQLDQMYLEVGDNSLRAKMDAFWDGWQELSRHPADSAPRTALLERAQTLVDGIHDRFRGLKSLQDMADEDIMLTVERVNELSRQIAGLNRDIQRIIAQGDRPNDLFDRRDLLVDKLSSVIEITVDRRDADEFMVHTGGLVLVQGRIGRQFEVTRGVDTEGYGRISWADTGDLFEPVRGRGSLSALLELRDDTIEREIQTLDNLSMNFVDLVNENHRAGYGINGRTGLDFFTEHHFVTNVNGNYDRNGDGDYDSTYIYRVNGTNRLDERAQVGLEGTITLSAFDPAGAGGAALTQIPYYAEDTVADIISRINNSGADVTARLNREGRLSLKGTVTESRDEPDFVIRHIEDSGRFLEGYAGLLAASGPEGAFNWETPDAVAVFRGGEYSTAPVAHPSGWIEVNPVLRRETASVASGYGENGRPANPGNGEAALAIAAIRNTVVTVGRLGTFDDYFADSMGRIGLLGEQSGRALETQAQIMKQLHDMRQSVAGVNMDEELANMIKYQHGYQAAARFVTTVNSMLDILMNLGG